MDVQISRYNHIIFQIAECAEETHNILALFHCILCMLQSMADDNIALKLLSFRLVFNYISKFGMKDDPERQIYVCND